MKKTLPHTKKVDFVIYGNLILRQPRRNARLTLISSGSIESGDYSFIYTGGIIGAML